MNLVAVALLCQIYPPMAGNVYFEDCQKYYVRCWNKKSDEQRSTIPRKSDDTLLAECVLEKK